MTKTLLKDTLRSIAANRLRFISIIVIVTLGVSFYVGIKSASPKMSSTANEYFITENLMDVRVTSQIAFEDEDISEIEKLENVDMVVKSKYVDGFAVIGKSSLVDTNGTALTCRVRGMNFNEAKQFNEKGEAEASYMNRIVLRDGRYPENSSECVIDERARKTYDGIEIGKTITVTGDDESIGESLKNESFTIVGTVSSPMYISVDCGNTQVGSGTLSTFIYVNPDIFVTDEVNELYVRAKGSDRYDKFSSEYDTLVTNLAYEIQKMSHGIIDAKLSSLKSDYSEKIAIKEKDISDYKSSSAAALEEKQKSIDEFKAYVDNEDAILADAQTKNEKEIAAAKKSFESLQSQFNTLNSTYEANVKTYDNKSSEIKGYSELKALYDDLNTKHATDGKALATLKSTLDSASSNLDAKKSDVGKYNSAVSDYESSVSSINSRISSLQSDIDSLTSQKSSSESKISGIASDISDLESRIETLEDKVSAGTITPAEQLNLSAYKVSLATKRDNLSSAKSELANINSSISSKNSSLAAAKSDLSAANSGLTTARGNLSAAKSEQSLAQTNYDNAKGNYNSAKTAYDADTATLNKYLSSMNQLTAGQSDLVKLQQTIADEEKQLKTLKTEVTVARVKYTLAQKQGSVEVENAKYDLNAAKQKYDTVDGEYIELQDEINLKLKNLNGDLKKLKNMLKNADSITWSTTAQTEFPGHESFASSIENVESMASLFPVFFLLTAMIACFVIMIKTIEEGRGDIGIFKALGYSNFSIILKYVAYSSIAWIAGTAVGSILGACVLPPAVYSIYSTIYSIPKIGVVFNFKYILLGFLISAVTTLPATVIAGVKVLRYYPAVLLRPKTVYYNKRTLLENFPVLWGRMSYGMVFIARAISRSRKRVVAGTVGIACCTALILSAFGLANSATAVADSQYGKNGIFKYDEQIILNTEQDADDSDILADVRSDIKTDSAMLMCTVTVTGAVSTDIGAADRSVHVIVPESSKNFSDFIELEAVSGSASLDEGGTVVTEKFAQDIGASVGDIVYFTDMEGNVHPTTVTGIVKNYINNYAYFSPASYESVFVEAPSYKYIICVFKDYLSESDIANFSSSFLKYDEVSGVATSKDMSKSADTSIDRVLSVMFVFIVSACLLAAIVMYTISNINISERTREIANIKVVGFSDNEVLIYVNRENIISSVIGIILGLVGGIFLHKALVGFISVDSIMYGSRIFWWSYVVTILIIVFVAAVTSLPIRSKINSVNMAETLKTIE